jgi:hypothetical protein
MSLWLAGYPKTPDFDVRFESKADIKASTQCPLYPQKRTLDGAS